MHQNTPEAFSAQLREGHYNELRVALFFMLNGCLCRIGFDGSRYDIEVKSPRSEFHVEVKWDKRASDTGNLYFEVENTRQKRPSGVMSTSAEYWVHVIGSGSDALLMRVDDLKSFLDKGRFRSMVTGGADSNSRGLLVPRAAIPFGQESFRLIQLPTVESFFGDIFRSAQSKPT